VLQVHWHHAAARGASPGCIPTLLHCTEQPLLCHWTLYDSNQLSGNTMAGLLSGVPCRPCLPPLPSWSMYRMLPCRILHCPVAQLLTLVTRVKALLRKLHGWQVVAPLQAIDSCCPPMLQQLLSELACEYDCTWSTLRLSSKRKASWCRRTPAAASVEIRSVQPQHSSGNPAHQVGVPPH
jgi:hypothetical protein